VLYEPHPPVPELRDLRWVGLDLDGTIAQGIWDPENPTPEIGEPIWDNIAKITPLVGAGFKIVVFSARPWSDTARVQAWLMHYRIPYEGIILGKPLLACLIDDRAVNAWEPDWLAAVQKVVGE
jgi:hypothetical protein